MKNKINKLRFVLCICVLSLAMPTNLFAYILEFDMGDGIYIVCPHMMENLDIDTENCYVDIRDGSSESSSGSGYVPTSYPDDPPTSASSGGSGGSTTGDPTNSTNPDNPDNTGTDDCDNEHLHKCLCCNSTDHFNCECSCECCGKYPCECETCETCCGIINQSGTGCGSHCPGYFICNVCTRRTCKTEESPYERGKCIRCKIPCQAALESDPLVYMQLLPSKTSWINGARFGCVRTDPNQDCNGDGIKGDKKHGGIDLDAPIGTPIYNMFSGRVVGVTSTHASFGVWIRVASTVNGENIEVWYAHLSEESVSYNQQLTAGEIIGKTGESGTADDYGSAGPHLHLTIYKNGTKLDPEDWIKSSFDTQGNVTNPCDF